jgi:chromosome segregation ATPase
MSQSAAGNIENNSNTLIGSTLSNSAVTAGSNAQVFVGVSEEDQEFTIAIAELREALQEAEAEIDRRDDETRERLELAESRLKALEEELQNAKPKRDWGRINKLMTGIRDALTGLTSLTISADGLWEAVEKIIR